MQFISKYIQEGLSAHVVRLALVALYHQEINVQVEVTWRTLQTISYSIMVHVRVSEEYIHFELICTTSYIFCSANQTIGTFG